MKRSTRRWTATKPRGGMGPTSGRSIRPHGGPYIVPPSATAEAQVLDDFILRKTIA
jgi:hypothetical protein